MALAQCSVDTHERRMVTPHSLCARTCPSNYWDKSQVETYFCINSFALAVLANGCLNGYFSVWKLFHSPLNQ